MITQVLHRPTAKGRYDPTWEDPSRQATLLSPRDVATGAPSCWSTATPVTSPLSEQIVDLAMNASALDTARVLDVSPTTVIKELKKKSRSCSQ